MSGERNRDPDSARMQALERQIELEHPELAAFDFLQKTILIELRNRRLLVGREICEDPELYRRTGLPRFG